MRKNAKNTTADELDELLATSYPGEEPAVPTDQADETPEVAARDIHRPADWEIPAPPTEQKGSGSWERNAVREAASAPDFTDYSGMPTRHRNPRVRATQTRVIDLVSTGHGFVIKIEGEVRYVRNCSECGEPVTTDLAECEFPEIPWEECGCNSCEEARMLIRKKAGRPAETCSAECQRKRRNRRARERRAAERAEWARLSQPV